MSVLYVYPSDEVDPEYVVPFVRLRVGIDDWVILPTSQSL